MCLLLIAYRQHPRYPLILLANRDEFYQRPTAPAAVWDTPPLLAGRDLAAGGTWLGATNGGRIAAVTNVREPGAAEPPNMLSRGEIPVEFLASGSSPRAFSAQLQLSGERYRGFNALLYDPQAEVPLICAGNRHAPFPFTSGIHGISNGAADAPWPKVRSGKLRLASLIQSLPAAAPAETLLAPSMALLQDATTPADSQLPDTGVGRQLERALAPIFIHIPPNQGFAPETGGYGTRASTLVMVDATGAVNFWEQRYNDGRIDREAAYFYLAPPPYPQ
ncbi:NRDE family protein [Microbulbifer bruguierae]|uniref:NRDE family protein n=1 Tax=Microbulbifer bruguierae TaxID=3029061 RepID=A0ABY8NBA1_9GAMM|nr:NRDE family protein [Microbulbifer bruguierae]WGL15955.1 NRDE family protein [Microbulbifer bruguierae]